MSTNTLELHYCEYMITKLSTYCLFLFGIFSTKLHYSKTKLGIFPSVLLCHEISFGDFLIFICVHIPIFVTWHHITLHRDLCFLFRILCRKFVYLKQRKLHYLVRSETYLEPSQTSMMKLFCEKSLRLLASEVNPYTANIFIIQKLVN